MPSQADIVPHCHVPPHPADETPEPAPSDELALAKERRKADTAANDARLEKLGMALTFISENTPTAAILAEGASGVQAFNMFDELPADLAKAISGAMIAAAKFAADEFAAG